MGAAASTLPEIIDEKPPEIAPPNLPQEIVEEILLRLPVKSLLRFSAASKAWHSMISDEFFVRKHKSRAPKMMVAIPSSVEHVEYVYTRPLSSISPEQIIDHRHGEPHLPAPFYAESEFKPGEFTFVLASCGHLFCVEYGRSSLFLWNPSMGPSAASSWKLPKPPSVDSPSFGNDGEFCFGVGHSLAGDHDYKVLMSKTLDPSEYDELYSLSNDSWKTVPPFPGRRNECRSGVFADGALHWLAYRRHSDELVIVSFDLTAEKYAEEAAPIQHGGNAEGLGLFRGKLGVFMNYESRYVLSVMEECGGGGGRSKWNEVFEYRYGWVAPPLMCWSHEETGMSVLRGSAFPRMNVFMYIDEETLEKTVFRFKSNQDFFCELYRETLVSPAMCRRREPAGQS